MEVRKLAGWLLIVIGLVNISHAAYMRITGLPLPGALYGLLTAFLVTAGVMLVSGIKRAGAKT